MSVLVAGSANMDFVFHAGRLPLPGETLLGNGFFSAPGGKGANQAAAIGMLGGSVSFLGCVGSDFNGQEVRQSLESKAVNLDFVSTHSEAATGVAGIFLGDEGQNSIVVYSGANDLVSADQVTSGIRSLKPKVVLTQLEIPIDAVMACSIGPIFIFNPAPYRQILDELFSKIDIIVPNETECLELTGLKPTNDATCDEAAVQLLDRGIKAVVITLGERGCFVRTPDDHLLIKPPVVNAIDTTAAGDAFCGALAYFISLDLPLFRACEKAVFVAALSTTKSGAQSSMPSASELKHRFPEQF